jgi:hypothetical protein
MFDDYGYFGKGVDGYAHYMQAFERSFGKSGSVVDETYEDDLDKEDTDEDDLDLDLDLDETDEDTDF